MKQIEPIDVWQNGTTKTAVKLQAQGTSVGISGEQYAAWGADDDYVYDIIAEDLNLVIVGDWVDSED